METIKVKPVAIIGNCPANLTLESEIQIKGMNIENPSGNPICFLALSHFPVSTWQLQSGHRFFARASCPGCITDLDNENRVVFLLGHEDKWELSKVISEYLRLSKQVEEPEKALQLKTEAINHQNNREYPQALDKMIAALEVMKSTASSVEDL